MENIGNNLIFKCKTRKMGFLYAPKRKHMTIVGQHGQVLDLSPDGEVGFRGWVLIVFIPLVPVNDTGFETSAEGLENFFIL